MAVAITRHNQARGKLEALQAAQEKATRERGDAHFAIREAEERLRQARADATRHYVNHLLGETDVVDDVGVAQRELDDARLRLSRAEDGLRLLAQEVIRADTERGNAHNDLIAAIGEVCVWAPAVTDLVDAFFAAFKQAATLFAVLDKLRVLDTLPPTGKSFEGYGNFRSHHDYPVDEKVVAEWDAALTALRTDPDVQLPEITHRAPQSVA